MPRFNLVVESPVSKSVRKKQLEGIFELPPQENIRHEWDVDIPYEEKEWGVGLIVGPSGSGKTQISKKLFGKLFEKEIIFKEKSVIDDFRQGLSISDIAAVCQAVGFNTIPSWLKPYHVLSNGEKFRVELAKRLIESNEMIIFDEFTSVVDRQVAKIASHAVQKYIRKNKKQFVAISCHYDVIDWLQPDWIYDTAHHTFQWRYLQQRPKIECVFSPVAHSAWEMFAPYHYMSRDLIKSARCYGLFINNQIVSFAGLVHRPMSRGAGKGHSLIFGVSRLVTLPDYQGLGLSFVLVDYLASIYKAVNKRLRTYPAHPALIRSFDRSAKWAIIKKPAMSTTSRTGTLVGIVGGRPCAVFEYAGEAATKEEAELIFSYFNKG